MKYSELINYLEKSFPKYTAYGLLDESLERGGYRYTLCTKEGIDLQINLLLSDMGIIYYLKEEREDNNITNLSIESIGIDRSTYRDS